MELVHGTGWRIQGDTAPQADRTFIALSSNVHDISVRGLEKIFHQLGANAIMITGMRLSEPIHNHLSEQTANVGLELNFEAPEAFLRIWLKDPDDGASLTAQQLAHQFSWSYVSETEDHVILDRGLPHSPEVISRLGLARRLPQLSHREFVNHWIGIHAPLVVDQGPLFGAYVISEGRHSTDPSWDGCVEQVFGRRALWDEHDQLILTEKPLVRADLARFLGGVRQFEGSDHCWAFRLG